VLLQGWIQRPVTEDLFRRAGHDFEAVKRQARTAAFRPIDLGATFSAAFDVETQPRREPQRLGKLTGAQAPGRDGLVRRPLGRLRRRRARRAGQARPPRRARRRARHRRRDRARPRFAAGPRPERTLVFAAWTAEERGLLGAEHYASQPALPARDQAAANLTIDTLQTAGPRAT
jgi:hypothetical protein